MVWGLSMKNSSLALTTAIAFFGLGFPMVVAAQTAPLHVLLYSDAGFATPSQQSIADAMFLRHQEMRFDFAISAGDNNQGGYTDFFTIQETFEAPYQALIKDGVRFYAALGNHDHMLYRDSKELAYSSQVDAENLNVGGFVMPSPDFVVKKPGLKIVFLDVATQFMKLNWDTARQAFAEQEICDHSEKFLAVVAHYPLWSTGWHGDTVTLQEKLLPILEKCPAEFVIAGHDHHAELFHEGNTRYLVVGNAGEVRDNQSVSAKQSVFRTNALGFAELFIAENTAKIVFRDATNAVVFEENVEK